MRNLIELFIFIIIFAVFFIGIWPIIAKFAEKFGPWQRTYIKIRIRDGWQLKMSVKGSPLGIYLPIQALLVWIAVDSLLYFLSDGDWTSIMAALILLAVPVLMVIYPITYVCCLYNDAISIGILHVPEMGNNIIEIPFSDIRAIHEKSNRDRSIKTTYQTTFSLQLFKYRLIYILCEYKGMKHYYKIRVNDEIYQELNKRFP